MEVISNLFLNLLIVLHTTTGNLGLAILFFTFLVRTALLPLTLPSLRAREQINKLQPQLKKLKRKYTDKKALQKAQMDLYKRYNVNPLAGCLPQIVQIGLLILIYRVLLEMLGPDTSIVDLHTSFLWFDLTQPDSTYVLPVLTAVTQLFLSLMIAPGGEVPDLVPNASKSKKVIEDNKKEEDFAEMAASMQQQMIFIMPIMTGFIAINFPSGVALYWVATTLFSIGQQLYISGPGGLVMYFQRAKLFFVRT